MARRSPLTALAAVTLLLLLTAGCVQFDGGGVKIDANVSGLTEGLGPGSVGLGGNGSAVSFPIGSDFETGRFEGTTMVVRLTKVEKMDRIAVVDPDGRKLDEVPVEPAQRRLEIPFDAAPAPGTYELVKLEETDGGLEETGSVTFTLTPRPVLVSTKIRNGTGRATVRNDGNAPFEITAIEIRNDSGVVTGADLVEHSQAFVSERVDGDTVVRTVVTGDDGLLVAPGQVRRVQGPRARNATGPLRVAVRTRHSGTLTR